MIHSIDELKIRASILSKEIKSLRAKSTQDTISALAQPLIRRLKCLAHFKQANETELIDLLKCMKLKHCLNIVANENGFDSWKKLLLESKKIKGNSETRLYRYNQSEANLNDWFNNYEDAKSQLDEKNGYLLPYKNHFFICQSSHIRHLGLDPNDADWEKIGWDWVKPLSLAAKKRLEKKLDQQKES